MSTSSPKTGICTGPESKRHNRTPAWLFRVADRAVQQSQSHVAAFIHKPLHRGGAAVGQQDRESGFGVAAEGRFDGLPQALGHYPRLPPDDRPEAHHTAPRCVQSHSIV